MATVTTHAQDAIDIDLHSLPPPGTPAFFPTLLSRIRTAAPTLPLDPVVLQSLLLCIIAGDKHLVLRTRDEDVGLVLKLAFTILSSVFGFQSHKLKVRPHPQKYPHSNPRHHERPHEFLRLLFLPSPSGGAPSSGGHKQRPSSGHRHFPRHSSGSKPSTPGSGARISIPRSTSSPCQVPTPTSTSSPRPPLRASGLHTDPTPYTQHPEELILPRALVVSGLEHTTAPVQRELIRVLAERKVVLETEEAEGIEGERDGGTWNFPDGFLMVYVCQGDARERPEIHKSLLDRFAMSTTINLQPSTRAILSPRTTSTPTLPTPILPLPFPDSTPSPSTNPLLPPRLIAALRTIAETRTYLPPPLALYTSDLFSAVRHHHALDGTLLSARSRRNADDLIRAARAIGGDYTGIELIRGAAALRDGASDDDASSLTEEGGEQYEAAIDDVGSIKIGLAPWDCAITTTPVSSRPSFFRSENGASELDVEGELEMLDVSEADIARIVPRVVSHRLRVRDGPADEILGGAMYGAVIERGDRVERTTVKDVLVRILSEV